MTRIPAPWRLRLFRAALLFGVVFLLHQQSHWLESQRSPAISVRVARKYFPAAHRVQLRDIERGLHFVVDSRGDTIGCLLTTSPQSDGIQGYSGPNNLLIALDAQGTVSGVELLRSGDTAEHVGQVKASVEFWRGFLHWKPHEGRPPEIRAVSGATLTSLAIAEAVQQRLAGAAPSLRFPDPITLAEVQQIWTNATQLRPERSRWRAEDNAGRLLGFVVRTSPQADNVSGYRGPTECLVALRPDGRTVTDLRIRTSYDTDSYVDQLRVSPSFLRTFIGRSVEDLAALEVRKERIEAVSGATQTSIAVAEGLKRRAIKELKEREGPKPWHPTRHDWALAAVVAGALVMSFTSLRGIGWVRLVWQLILVGYVGLVSHDLLSLVLVQGWAAHGPALRTAPGLVLLATAALVVPWSSRRQIYCHHLCPHGAAQQLLGRVSRWRWSIPAPWLKRLEMIPTVLLGVGLVLALTGGGGFLGSLEAFDAWVWKTAGVVTIFLAVAGLIASVFVPQAYCRMGCPTGALLNFVRSAGSGDRFGRRDWLALLFLFGGTTVVLATRHWPVTEPVPEPTQWSGRVMGMEWRVKSFDEIADTNAVHKVITTELEWAESMISHWRPTTDLTQFNQSQDTNAHPVPWPVLTLSRLTTEVSRETGGALDITVGPLVKLWGFGPPPRRTQAPTEQEIDALRSAVGWQRLGIGDGMLRKEDPRMEVDLSCIAEGWTIDHLTRILQRRGLTNLLVELGGEMRASGRWTIAIEHPTRRCLLVDEAIGTSGTYREHHASGPREVSHLLDARTGRPVTHATVSVSVRHAECARADVWATALNILGRDEGMPLAERLKLAAQFVVEENGGLTVQETSAWRARDAAVRGANRDGGR